jgi:hypothetical protein
MNPPRVFTEIFESFGNVSSDGAGVAVTPNTPNAAIAGMGYVASSMALPPPAHPQAGPSSPGLSSSSQSSGTGSRSTSHHHHGREQYSSRANNDEPFETKVVYHLEDAIGGAYGSFDLVRNEGGLGEFSLFVSK